MLNYEKALVAVVYRFNNEGLLELNAEAPTVGVKTGGSRVGGPELCV